MAQSIFITSAEGHSGKSTVALGVLDALSHATPRVGVFRAIARSTVEPDYVLEMLLDHDGVDLDYDDCIGVTYDDVRTDPDAALATIVERYKAVEAQCDAVVVVGSDYTDVGSPAELAYNARIAANLGTPVLLVLGGRSTQDETQPELLGSSLPRTAAEMGQIADLALAELAHGRADLFAVVANRADPDSAPEAIAAIERSLAAFLSPAHAKVPVWAIPEDRYLVAPSMRGIMRSVDGELLAGDPDRLTREALGVVVAGMSMVNVLPRLLEGAVVIIPADRSEVLLATLLANASGTFPSISGIVLNGGFELPETIMRLLDGLGSQRADHHHRPRHVRDRRPHHEHPWTPGRRLAAPLRHGAVHLRDERRHRRAAARVRRRAADRRDAAHVRVPAHRARARRAQADRAARGRRRPRPARGRHRAQARHRRPRDPRRAVRGARPRHRAGHRHPVGRGALARSTRCTSASSPRSTRVCARTRASRSLRPPTP